MDKISLLEAVIIPAPHKILHIQPIQSNGTREICNIPMRTFVKKPRNFSFSVKSFVKQQRQTATNRVPVQENIYTVYKQRILLILCYFFLFLIVCYLFTYTDQNLE